MSVSVEIGEVQVHVFAVRRDRDTEQTLLVARCHLVRQVDRDIHVGRNGPHQARLGGDVHRVVARPGGKVEAAIHFDRCPQRGSRLEAWSVSYVAIAFEDTRSAWSVVGRSDELPVRAEGDRYHECY